MVAEVKRAMAITARINRLTFDDAAEVRALFGELIGTPVDDGFVLIPPFHATGGTGMKLGRNVFVNQNCTFYDLGGLEIGDDVMIGPNVSLITSGHPVEPSRRRDGVVAKPIVIAGLQRPGTTVLHRLLAADPRARALMAYEALHPTPLPGEGASVRQCDPWRSACAFRARLPVRSFRLFPEFRIAPRCILSMNQSVL